MIFKRTENKQDDGRRRPVIASPPPLWAQRLTSSARATSADNFWPFAHAVDRFGCSIRRLKSVFAVSRSSCRATSIGFSYYGNRTLCCRSHGVLLVLAPLASLSLAGQEHPDHPHYPTYGASRAANKLPSMLNVRGVRSFSGSWTGSPLRKQRHD